MSKTEDKRVFCGWLQLDLRPFKHTLMNVIKRWSWMFKEHLLNHVNQRLDKYGGGEGYSHEDDSQIIINVYKTF